MRFIVFTPDHDEHDLLIDFVEARDDVHAMAIVDLARYSHRNATMAFTPHQLKKMAVNCELATTGSLAEDMARLREIYGPDEEDVDADDEDLAELKAIIDNTEGIPKL